MLSVQLGLVLAMEIPHIAETRADGIIGKHRASAANSP